MSDFMENKYKRVLLGVLFIIAGVIIGYIADNSDSIITSVCGPDSPLWCLPLKVALYDIGLRSISYTFIVLGIVVSVLYNYIAELVSSILSFALNHVANSSKVLIDAMEKNKLSREESKGIIVSATSRYMGYFDENSHSIGEFFASKVIDQSFKDGGFWRKDYHAIINVERLSADEYKEIHQRYLRWNETSTFTIVNVNAEKTYRYLSTSTVEIIAAEDVKEIIAHYKYDIKMSGAKIFSFDDFREKIQAHDFLEAPEFKEGGLTVAILHGDFVFSFTDDIVVRGQSADIVVDEESFISTSDRIYQLAFNEPTKRVTFRFNLPHDLDIYHYGITGRKFGTATSTDIHLNRPSPNRIRIDMGDWTLPGLVAILAWKEKMPVGSSDSAKS